MTVSAGGNVLVVPPFECSWLVGDQGRFAEAGKGLVSFEAMAENDVTVVFKEQAVGKHYRTDTGPSYTVVLGSHRNRRFKIEVDGRTVVDVPRVVLQPTLFERYWINVYDGVISVGKGDVGMGIVYQWVDSKPNDKIQYVGLSSWDKHVGYRNIQVLSPLQPSKTVREWDESSGFGRYLESEDLADVSFVTGPEGRTFPAHWILLDVCCSKFSSYSSAPGDVVHLPDVEYSILHAMLQFMYTGCTQVMERDLDRLLAVASDFGFKELLSKCEKLQRKREISLSEVWDCSTGASKDTLTIQFAEKLESTGDFLSQLPINRPKLFDMYENGICSDVELCVEGIDECIRAHRLILSAWSNPFAKMFTNGMRECKKDRILLRDVSWKPFIQMVKFMYRGDLDLSCEEDLGSLLLSLLVSADQFGVHFLQRRSVDLISQFLSEDSACAVLLVAASVPSCQALCDRCEELCAKHFDFCAAFYPSEFRLLDFACLRRILQHPDLRVTSEEKVLDAILTWGAKCDGLLRWEGVKDCSSTFTERGEELNDLLMLVRFPLMPVTTLQKLEASNICQSIPVLHNLVLEALDYRTEESLVTLLHGSGTLSGRHINFPKPCLRFSPRMSAYKELQYICDGDRNGVFHYIGTSYGVHAWMNPVLMKKITVTASSPPSRFTDAKTIVSGNFQGTSFAGPCLEDGGISAWWKVDLGSKHQLLCNYYTIRHDGSGNFVRSWSFQGSADGVNWKELSSHMDERTICRPGQYASWPVLGSSASIPCRFFRVVLTGPTADNSNPWNFSLCFLELYGYFQAFEQ